MVIEDLTVQGMIRNKHLAKCISDQGWHKFSKMLEYNLQPRNAELIEIGRFEPSSKMCSRCGNIKHDLKPSERTYHCDKCGPTINHDLNAAINIRNIRLIKVAQDMQEFPPVEIATSGLSPKEGG